MAKKKTDEQGIIFDEKNAEVLAEMLADPKTPEAVKLHIINELNEESKTRSFFETMFNEDLSLGECPCCGHEDHWLIPADDLAQMGYVVSQEDPRVKKHTTEEDCPEYAEACSKKRNTA